MRPSYPKTRFDADIVRTIAQEHAAMDGALLPILHALNDRFGCVEDEAVRIVADVLNLSRAEVHGVVTFYHDFRREPAGRHVVKLCRAEACQSMGGERVASALEAAFGIKTGETTPDGRITLEAVYCLGNCALSPAALVDGKLHGRVDAARLQGLVAEDRA